VLASLLPATDDPEGDLDLFEMLMRMDPEGLWRRAPKVTAVHIMDCPAIPSQDKLAHISRTAERPDEDDVSEKGPPVARWRRIDLSFLQHKTERDAERAWIDAERDDLRRRAFLAMPFSQQVAICERVEAVENMQTADDPLYSGIWAQVNARLGTVARSLPELVDQLGFARFGHRPVVGDPFCGGGSIPFEAARMGCEVVASDLNPVAAMLTWGALNIIGADTAARKAIADEQRQIAKAVDLEITRLRIEHNANGDRAKAYLYCMEVIDPQTGWKVPLLPSLVISRNRKCVARLEPDYDQKRFNILVEEDVTAVEIKGAETGTVSDGHLVYKLANIPGEEEREWRIPIARLRGDGEGPELPGGGRGNRLRPWGLSDIAPRPVQWVADAPPVARGMPQGAWVGGDIWLERLYAIQWMDGSDIRQGKRRPRTFFTAPDAADVAREAEVLRLVSDHLPEWQSRGLVPDMPIEFGEKTDEPIRTRGWTYWHHLFTPRHLLVMAVWREQCVTASSAVCFASILDQVSRLARWAVGYPGRPGVAASADQAKNVFYNQAFNTLYTHAARSAFSLADFVASDGEGSEICGTGTVESLNSSSVHRNSSLWIYDPPYADAVHYHEITEYFIAWLRRSPPPPFDQWKWDSKRPLAIQGKGEKFRVDMVAALRAMADHMPDNGLQVCMFTHKDAGVWADMAQIVWGAGLQTTAAWYVSTETTSELKQGGYVQGTVLMVLRKRKGEEQGFRSDIVPEIRARVGAQVETLTGMNQRARGRGRDENVFSDADIQMAGYAAALEVLTGYTHIDGVDMTREALRPRATKRNDAPGIVEEMIALAVQTANELMVPDGIAEGMWERLSSTERFYLKMTAIEATWPAAQRGGKLDDYQNFARVYRAEDWEDLMAERSPNQARLNGASEFKRALMTGHAFSTGAVRPTLYAISEQCRATAHDEDPKVSGDRVLHGLRDHFGVEGWLRARDNVRTLATWFGRTWERQRAEEAAAARVVAGLIGSERLGG
jgi:hypothetical protein